MKKLFLLTLSSILILFSCAEDEKTYKPYKKFHSKAPSSYSGGGAVNNLKSENRAKNREKVKSPVSSIGVGTPKINAKNNNLGSIKSKDHSKIVENSEAQNLYSDLYDDFSEIYRNGRYVGQYKIGNTYEIEGVPYYPQEYEDYEEVGVASWYGEDFHGKLTANGEIYNLDSMTAAHQTLPLPSIVRVTNLKNGKSVLVRVNDRGPFAKSRIIDLSKKAAQMLDYRDKGTAVVKVEYMPKETDKLLKSLKIKR